MLHYTKEDLKQILEYNNEILGSGSWLQTAIQLLTLDALTPLTTGNTLLAVPYRTNGNQFKVHLEQLELTTPNPHAPRGSAPEELHLSFLTSDLPTGYLERVAEPFDAFFIKGTGPAIEPPPKPTMKFDYLTGELIKTALIRLSEDISEARGIQCLSAPFYEGQKIYSSRTTLLQVEREAIVVSLIPPTPDDRGQVRREDLLVSWKLTGKLAYVASSGFWDQEAEFRRGEPKATRMEGKVYSEYFQELLERIHKL